MKSLKRVLIAIVLLVLLTGCSQGTDKLKAVDSWLQSTIPSTLYDDYDLPTSRDDVLISWSSSDLDLLDDTGKVTNPSKEDIVLLEYTLTYKKEILKNTIDITIGVYSIDTVESRFKASIPGVIYEDRILKTDFGGYTVIWSSSNPEIFSNIGEYNKGYYDQDITITYKISNGVEKREGAINATVMGYNYTEKINYISGVELAKVMQDIEKGENVDLPKTDSVFSSSITWQCDSDIFTSDGDIVYLPYQQKVKLTATITIGEYPTEEEFYICIPKKESITLDDFLNSIAVKEISSVKFEHTVSSGEHYDIDQSYNWLPFYTNKKYLDYVTVQLATSVYNSHFLSEVKFITIHDTAMVLSSQNAKLLADVLSARSAGGTCWHFSVDENGAYQSIPFDRVAYHAGDGTGYNATLYDTGVLATNKYPTITIGSDGYYYFNGTKSNTVAPTTSTGLMLSTKDITDSGLYTEIGANGNYYITKTWYSGDYRKIGNHGGNMSSIGIESCVNAGSDYRKTLAVLSKLVAYLCLKFDLTTDNVMQHNNFSGKECPRAIRYANYWDEFKDLVAIEMLGQSEFSDATFTWTSLTPSLLSNDGKISLDAKAGDTISYKVKVVYKGETIERTFSTKLI